MCLPQVIKSFQNYRGVATTFYPTLVYVYVCVCVCFPGLSSFSGSLALIGVILLPCWENDYIIFSWYSVRPIVSNDKRVEKATVWSTTNHIQTFLGSSVKRITNEKTGLKNKFGVKRCETYAGIIHSRFGSIEGRKLIPLILSLNL